MRVSAHGYCEILMFLKQTQIYVYDRICILARYCMPKAQQKLGRGDAQRQRPAPASQPCSCRTAAAPRDGTVWLRLAPLE